MCLLRVRGLMGNKRLWRKRRVSSFSSVHIVLTQRAYSALHLSVQSQFKACSVGWISDLVIIRYDWWMLSLIPQQCQRWRHRHRCSGGRDRRSRSLQGAKREEEEERSQEGRLWVRHYTSSSSSSSLSFCSPLLLLLLFSFSQLASSQM